MTSTSTVANEPLRVGVIGFGYWGPNLARNFNLIRGCTVTAIAERDAERRTLAIQLFPLARIYEDGAALIQAEDVDAVAIAVPAADHFKLAMAALDRGKHVLVSKPLTPSAEAARTLIARAAERGAVLMVDHTFIYTGAVRKIRQLIDRGDLGDLYYFASSRVNLGKLQPDIGVLWDLAVHDLAILDYLIDEQPISIQASGACHVGAQDEVATMGLVYPSGFHAQIRVSWLSPLRLRLAELVGSRRMIAYDDTEPSEKVKVYDKGVMIDPSDETTDKPIYRAGDVSIPLLDQTEALQVMARHFLDCVQSGTRPLTDGEAGLRVVEWLEAASSSSAQDGVPVQLIDLRGEEG
jgi:predicted dehydrogenase